jgi:hypothetical protein
MAKLGSAQVVLVDLSILGARIEHHSPLSAGIHSRIAFAWEDEPLDLECRIVRSRLERFSTGADGLTVYHAGLEFVNMDDDVRAKLKRIIAVFITRALEEQKLNARGVIPQHDVAKMPIFRRGGMLTANSKDVKESVGAAVLPSARVAIESGYVCYQIDHNTWRRKRTHDPGQPPDGFTISALEDAEQAEMLCEAYLRSDADGRRMIQLFAQLSIMEGEGNTSGRFDP